MRAARPLKHCAHCAVHFAARYARYAARYALHYVQPPCTRTTLSRALLLTCGRLVWCPPAFSSFVLVDDDGKHLATGCPTGQLPHARSRAENYMLVRGSKYATEAERVGSQN